MLCLALTLLPGCGFHLRGHAQIADKYNPLKIDATALKPAQLALIENALLQANAQISTQDIDANVLSVSFTQLKNQQIARSSASDVTLIRLSLQLDYSLKSPSLQSLADNQIIHYKDIELDNANVLSHQGLIEKGYQELEQSLTRALVYQLKRQ